MKRQSAATLLLAFVLAFLAPAARAAGPVYPVGVNVGLEPPKSMQLSKNFPGFQDEAAGAAILMTEVPPEAYDKIIAGLNPDVLEKQGLLGAKREDWPVKDGKGIFVSATQRAGAITLHKWIVVATGEKTAAVVTVQAPETAVDMYSDQVVRDALKSLTFRPPLPMDQQIAALPFTLGDRAGFRVVRVLAGSGVLMTDGPKDAIHGAEQPLIIVASGDGAIPGTLEQDRFAKQAFGGLAGIRGAEIKSARNLTLKGVPWHEIKAIADDPETKTKVFVVQAIRFSDSHYIRFIGMARERDQASLMKRFETIRDGVKPKEAQANAK
ncbi:hypothetical protein ACFQU1_04410 [Chelatococcus sp. GCM10030263]|uniref:hypothetical protein n=1 Tax=Chelatococcus sp. GCM10030263 TaxID=3273387 RepID=UPI003613F951